MNADGSGVTNVTGTATTDERQPAWSPDGEMIAFSARAVCAFPCSSARNVYTMNADGSEVTRLTDKPADEYSTDPDWQPLPVAYDFSGFFEPVDNLPTLNVVNAGRAIPVKFSLGGDHGLDIFAAGYPKSQEIECDSTAPVDGVEETMTAGGSSLSYDPGTDRYIYVWQTVEAWADACRQLVVKLADGSVHRANFRFK